MKKEIISLIGLHPFYGILNFDWGLAFLSEKIKGQSPFNLFIVADLDYQKAKKDGRLFAYFEKKYIITKIKELFEDDEDIIFIDYEANRFMIYSKTDIGKQLFEFVQDDEFNVAIGASVFNEKDEKENIATLFVRAEKALQDAYVTEDKFQIL